MDYQTLFGGPDKQVPPNGGRDNRIPPNGPDRRIPRLAPRGVVGVFGCTVHAILRIPGVANEFTKPEDNGRSD